MIKKIPYKLIAVSTFLTLTTTYAVTSVAAFASEIEQTNNGDMSLSANEEKMKKALQDAGVFAKSMNDYSYLLINNPDVNFEGITINGYANLPSKIVQDQKNARAHAVKWDTQIKGQLLDTLTDIVEYDSTFDNHYKKLVTAMKEADEKTLVNGITILQSQIQANKDNSQKLIQELTNLNDNIGQDVRAFGSDKDLLQSILKNQGAAIEDDQKRLNEVLAEVNYQKGIESKGLTMVKVPFIPTLIAGGIMIGDARSKLGWLEPELAKLRQTVDYKITLNRVVGVAFNNISEMHGAIDKAIKNLTYMSTQWSDLDTQYEGLLNHIKDASETTNPDSFLFLEANLDSAQESWGRLTKDAVKLKEGIQGLKVVSPQN